MDFLDNLMNAAHSAAQNVVKKSGEVVEYSKIKYAVFDANNAIRELKTQIGDAVYDNYKNDTPLDEIIMEKCKRIEDLESKIDELKENLDSKSEFRCSACGKAIKEDNSYCPYCGEKQAEDKDAEVSGYYTPGAASDTEEAEEAVEAETVEETPAETPKETSDEAEPVSEEAEDKTEE